MISFVGKTQDKEQSYHIIKTNDNGKTFFISVKGAELPIENDSIEGRRFVFSMPCNDKHPAWTQREITKVQSTSIVRTMWSPFKPTMQAKGYPKNGKFVVTHIKIDTKVYTYETNRFTKGATN